MALCDVTGTIQGVDESPVEDAAVRLTIQSTEQDQSGQIVDQVGIASDPKVVFTDAQGRFVAPVTQGAIALLEIPAINLRKLITVPRTASVDFTTLI